LVFLHDALQIEGAVQASLTESGQAALNIAVLHTEGCTFGLVVDEILSSQEIVVKPLVDSLRHTPVFSGATILGDGRVALILDAPGLARHCGVGATGAAHGVLPMRTALEPETQTFVLFRIRDDWWVAIPLSDVARLEELPRAAVERVGDQRVVQYRGGLMPLIRLRELLERTAAAANSTSGPSETTHFASIPSPSLQVVVHEEGGTRVGLVVEEILELVEQNFEIDAVTGRPGVTGSAVIRGRATDVLDIPELLAQAEIPGFGSHSMAAGA
jgi:two-component system chemotaxis sensor kinase CheA